MKKTLVAAMAVAAFAFAALPALASASPSMDTTEPHFTISGAKGELTSASAKVTCESVTGTGTFEGSSPYTTGTINLIFHDCHNPEAGVKCKSTGQPAGTISVPTLTFHLVTATDVTNGAKKDGILITPNHSTGKFAEFTCSFLVKVVVDGNGVIGTFTEDTNTTSNTFNINFAQVPGQDKQTYQTTCDTGNTEFDLEATINDAPVAETAVQIGEATTSFTNGVQGKLT